jgi:hypothetical protein
MEALDGPINVLLADAVTSWPTQLSLLHLSRHWRSTTQSNSTPLLAEKPKVITEVCTGASDPLWPTAPYWPHRNPASYPSIIRRIHHV